jgi:hypothetical protein
VKPTSQRMCTIQNRTIRLTDYRFRFACASNEASTWGRRAASDDRAMHAPERGLLRSGCEGWLADWLASGAADVGRDRGCVCRAAGTEAGAAAVAVLGRAGNEVGSAAAARAEAWRPARVDNVVALRRRIGGTSGGNSRGYSTGLGKTRGPLGLEDIAHTTEGATTRISVLRHGCDRRRCVSSHARVLMGEAAGKAKTGDPTIMEQRAGERLRWGSMHLARAGDGALNGRELTNSPMLLKTDVSAYTVVGASMAEVEAVERALLGRRRARSSHGVGRPMR